MTERYKRCIHCQVVYIYQASGYCQNKYNHHEYCSECYEAVCKVLREIKPKSEKVFEKTYIIDFETIKKWHEENDKNSYVEGTNIKLPPIRRIGVGLVNMKTGATQHVEYISGKNEFKGIEFQYSYWSDNPDEVEILLAKEKNLITGKMEGYWINYEK